MEPRQPHPFPDSKRLLRSTKAFSTIQIRMEHLVRIVRIASPERSTATIACRGPMERASACGWCSPAWDSQNWNCISEKLPHTLPWRVMHPIFDGTAQHVQYQMQPAGQSG